MYFNFDKFNQIDKPTIALCSPDRDILFSIGQVIYDTKLSLKYNALSEFSFTVAQFLEDGVTACPAYSYIKPKKNILVKYINKLDTINNENSMYFVISNVDEDISGLVPIKRVTCQSAEAELISKQLVNFSGTSLKFYDLLNPENTCLYSILKETNWDINHVSPELLSLYRSPNITNSTVYNALMTTIEQAYGCIFIFDTINRFVNVYTVDDATKNSNIFISFNNLIKTAKFKEITDEIATCLRCYGGSGLSIRDVNPLGTDKIYNFGYFKTTEWMSQDLIDAITDWEDLIESKQEDYALLLTQYKNLNIYLSRLQVDRTFLYDNSADSKVKDVHGVLLGEGLNELLEIQKVRMSSNPPQALGDIPTKIKNKKNQLSVNKAEIISYQNQIKNKLNQIKAINSQLSFENNFTELQLYKLRLFIFENSYTNNNIITTDIMTPAEIQDQSQQLYDAAQNIILLRSVPRYEFEAELVNLLTLPEFSKFAEEFDLGTIVKISLRDDLLIEAVILQVDVSFDKLDDFKVIFSNQLRLDNGMYRYSDLIDQMNNSSNFVNDNSQNLLDWSTNYKSDVSNFINSALDTTKNMLINSSDQEITMGKYGLQGKRKIDTDENGDPVYDPNQVWLTSQTLAFSDDGFDSVKLALGQVYKTNSNGSISLAGYGLIGEVILGNLIAGENLRISDENTTFNLDENGAVLTNASFTINKTGSKNKIYLNPDDGIIIKNKVGTTVFNADGVGNLTLRAKINAAAGGTIGGWDIDSDGISNGSNLYIRSTGDLKIGPLTISGDNGDFAGTFYAKKLVGQITGGSGGQIKQNTITDYNINSLTADKIIGGTISAKVSLYGPKLLWGGTDINNPNAYMWSDPGPNGTTFLKAKNGIFVYCGDFTSTSDTVASALRLSQTKAELYVPYGNPVGQGGTIQIGVRSDDPTKGNVIILEGASLDLTSLTNILLDSSSNQQGYTGLVTIGSRTLKFNKGILYDYF